MLKGLSAAPTGRSLTSSNQSRDGRISTNQAEKEEEGGQDYADSGPQVTGDSAEILRQSTGAMAAKIDIFTCNGGLS
jgi:hypothetical protein